MKNWLPSLAALGMAALTIFDPQIQVFIAAHATLSGVLGSVAVILAHFAPQPHK